MEKGNYIAKKSFVLKAFKTVECENISKAAAIIKKWKGDFIYIKNSEEETTMTELMATGNYVKLRDEGETTK